MIVLDLEEDVIRVFWRRVRLKICLIFFSLLGS